MPSGNNCCVYLAPKLSPLYMSVWWQLVAATLWLCWCIDSVFDGGPNNYEVALTTHPRQKAMFPVPQQLSQPTDLSLHVSAGVPVHSCSCSSQLKKASASQLSPLSMHSWQGQALSRCTVLQWSHWSKLSPLYMSVWWQLVAATLWLWWCIDSVCEVALTTMRWPIHDRKPCSQCLNNSLNQLICLCWSSCPLVLVFIPAEEGFGLAAESPVHALMHGRGRLCSRGTVLWWSHWRLLRPGMCSYCVYSWQGQTLIAPKASA